MSETEERVLLTPVINPDAHLQVSCSKVFGPVLTIYTFGRVEEVLARAGAAIALAKEEVGSIVSEGLARRVWGQALARLSRWEEAEATHMATARATHSPPDCVPTQPRLSRHYDTTKGLRVSRL